MINNKLLIKEFKNHNGLMRTSELNNIGINSKQILKLLEEVDGYIDFIKFKKVNNNNRRVDDITLASQESLGKDWLKPEDDEDWADL